jgi:hypothetical protein
VMVTKDWKKHNRRKKERRSQTPGSQKLDNCRATAADRFNAKCSRASKRPQYRAWLDYMRKWAK